MATNLAEEGRSLIDVLRKTDCNWVGVTAEAGAGHMRQLWDVKKTLEAAGIGMIWVELKIAESSEWAKIIDDFYNRMQNHPALLKLIRGVMEQSVGNKKIDEESRKLGQPGKLEEKISTANTYRSGKPVIIVTTHSVGAQSAAMLSQKNDNWGNIVLGEFVPDPWPDGLDIKMMTAIDSAGNRHVVIAHNEETAEIIRKLRPGRKVLPWGTLSPPDAMFEESEEKRDYSRIPPHLGIEFSGNEIPNYDKKILSFMETIKDRVRDGRIRLTVHTMHHPGTQKRIEDWTVNAGLTGSEYLHIITAVNIQEAVESRHEYAVGRDKFGKPDVVITKGGEVPLEDRGRTLVVAVNNSSPHEERDILVSMKEKPGFVVDMRELPEAMWWETIQQKLTGMPEGLPEVRSRALLALGMLVKLIQP